MPRETFQDWLDAFSETSFTEDFDAFAERVSLPLTINTNAATTVVETADALRVHFETWCRMLAKQGATDVIRSAGTVTPMGPNIIQGDYTTEILRNGARLDDPYPGRARLRFDGTLWRLDLIEIGTNNTSFPITVLRPTGRLRPPQAEPETGMQTQETGGAARSEED